MLNNVRFGLICLEAATINDLKVACGVKYKGGNQDVFMDTVPNECTSVMMNSNDFPGKWKKCYFTFNKTSVFKWTYELEKRFL